MLEIIDLFWQIVKTVVYFYILYKVCSAGYFWLTAPPEDKRRVQLAWETSPNLASFVKQATSLMEQKSV